MRQRLRVAVLGTALIPVLLALGGCESNAQTGALIGAGLGGLGGYIIGNEADKPSGGGRGHHYHHTHWRSSSLDR